MTPIRGHILCALEKSQSEIAYFFPNHLSIIMIGPLLLPTNSSINSRGEKKTLVWESTFRCTIHISYAFVRPYVVQVRVQNAQ